MPFLGVKAAMPVANLPLLAALTPPGHKVTLVDENVEPIDFDRCARADIVGVTGMNVQRPRMKEILTELKRRGVFTVVGGPWVTVQEDDFAGLADVIFIGEAEETWPQFLARVGARAATRPATSRPSDRYGDGSGPAPRPAADEGLRVRQRAVLARLPVRVRVLRHHRHLRPPPADQRPPLRCSPSSTPSSPQASSIAFIVDDNLIGNKKAIKLVLRDVIAWQVKHGYPLMFSTEASIDLAEDAELMQLMVEANISSVFVGIETPNEAALRETKKLQNLRARGGSMLDKVHRIQQAGHGSLVRHDRRVRQ